MSNKRDPRLNPRTDDMLLVGGTYRQVLTFKRGVSFWQRIGGEPWELRKVSTQDWHTWAKNAEVVHVAE